MVGNSWRIQLLGGFRIDAPDRTEVRIGSRKGRALVAILALNDGIAATRDELGAELWPSGGREKRRQSLRQAIKEVRDAFAPVEAIEATRDTCRLAIEGYVCDALECLRSGRGAGDRPLLPDMPEAVFDPYRIELAGLAPGGELAEAVGSAANLLEWAMDIEPSRALDLLHLSRELLPSMPLPILEGAVSAGLEAASPDHPLRGWGETQFAILLMWMGRAEEGIARAKLALAHVRPGEATEEWTAAVFAAAMLMVFRGRFARARRLLNDALEIASARGLKEAREKFQHGLAHSHAYEGDLDEALAILDRIAAPGDSPARALRLVHHACYLALRGRAGEARSKLDGLRAPPSTRTDARFVSQLKLAMAQTLAAEGRPEEARAAFEDLLAFSQGNALPLVAIHATEGLAVLAEDPAVRSAHLEQAAAMRARGRFPFLSGDLRRLGIAAEEGGIHANSRLVRTLLPGTLAATSRPVAL